MEASLRQLITFRAQHPNLVPGPSESSGKDADLDILSPAGARSRLVALPAPAFLVPAVLETLASTARYGLLTDVVPGEADAYCAQHAQRVGGLILTNDSDLLVYNLGPAASVTFFSDLEFSELENGSRGKREYALRYLSYDPTQIAGQLALSNPFGLATFAYEVEQDSSLGTSDLLRRARSFSNKTVSRPDFDLFLTQYQIPKEPVLWPFTKLKDTHGDGSGTTPRYPDPRVSELVCRYWSLGSELLSVNPPKEMMMYLPFLLDDPMRSSAWLIGAPERVLAYSILDRTASSYKSYPCFSEVGRRGQRIADTQIPLLDQFATIHHARAVNNKVQNLRLLFPELSQALLWTLYAVQLITQSATNYGKSPPTKLQLLLLLSRTAVARDWSAIHLSAQMQAALYSLHMLRQILWIALYSKSDQGRRQDQGKKCSEWTNEEEEEEQLLRTLSEHLESLPSLSHGLLNAYDNESMDEASKGLRLDHVLTRLFEFTKEQDKEERDKRDSGVEDDIDDGSASECMEINRRKSKVIPECKALLDEGTIKQKKWKKKKKRKGKKEKSRKDRKTVSPSRFSSNRFSVFVDQ